MTFGITPVPLWVKIAFYPGTVTNSLIDSMCNSLPAAVVLNNEGIIMVAGVISFLLSIIFGYGFATWLVYAVVIGIKSLLGGSNGVHQT